MHAWSGSTQGPREHQHAKALQPRDTPETPPTWKEGKRDLHPSISITFWLYNAQGSHRSSPRECFPGRWLWRAVRVLTALHWPWKQALQSAWSITPKRTIFSEESSRGPSSPIRPTPKDRGMRPGFTLMLPRHPACIPSSHPVLTLCTQRCPCAFRDTFSFKFLFFPLIANPHTHK